MADLIIRGMGMPGNRNTALIIYCDGTINLRAQMEDGEHLIPIAAKAVPLPEKHGRLIDADALIAELHKYFEDCGGRTTLEMLIKHATTIVPAEGGIPLGGQPIRWLDWLKQEVGK